MFLQLLQFIFFHPLALCIHFIRYTHSISQHNGASAGSINCNRMVMYIIVQFTRSQMSILDHGSGHKWNGFNYILFVGKMDEENYEKAFSA